MVSNRVLNRIAIAAVAALVTVAAVPAAAQVASVVAPPKVAHAETAQVQAKAIAAKRDTSVATRLSDMKSWVDSASGVAIKTTPISATPSADSTRPRITSADTARAASTVRAQPARVEATTFHNGAAAPATATLLPMIVLAGIALLSAGVVLIRAPRGEKARR